MLHIVKPFRKSLKKT